MADYQRILSYLYRYDHQNRMECKGFVKAEQRKETLKLTLLIEEDSAMENIKLQIYFYEKGQVHYLDTFLVKSKEEQIFLYEKEQLPEKFALQKQEGILLYYQDSMYYGSVWIGELLPDAVLSWRAECENRTKGMPEAIKRRDDSGQRSDTINAGQLAEEKEEEAVSKVVSTEEIKQEPTKKEGIAFGESTAKEIETKQRTTIEEDPKKVAAEKKRAVIKDGKVIFINEKEKSNLMQTELTNPAKMTEICAENSEENISEIHTEAVDSSKNKDKNMELSTKLSTKTPQTVDILWITLKNGGHIVDNITHPAFLEGYRMIPSDLKDREYGLCELAKNQFLLNGYEQYEHILAVKVRYGGEERIAIGVPGIYENREKYMAELYCFPVFLPMTENRIKTGGPGYWLHLLRG